MLMISYTRQFYFSPFLPPQPIHVYSLLQSFLTNPSAVRQVRERCHLTSVCGSELVSKRPSADSRSNTHDTVAGHVAGPPVDQPASLPPELPPHDREGGGRHSLLEELHVNQTT